MSCRWRMTVMVLVLASSVFAGGDGEGDAQVSGARDLLTKEEVGDAVGGNREAGGVEQREAVLVRPG